MVQHRNRLPGARPRPRLTTPLVRDGGELRPASWEEALDRVATGLRRVVDDHGSTAVGMFSCSKATNEVNFAAQKFRQGPCSDRTTSIPATALDTLPPSSVWRQYSEQAGAPPPTRRSTRPTSSCCGAPTPVKPTRSSSTHLMKRSRQTAAPPCFVVDPSPQPRRPASPIRGWGLSVRHRHSPGQRCRPSHHRQTTGTTRSSSPTPPRVSTPTSRPWSPTRSKHARGRSRACPQPPSPSWPKPTHAPRAPQILWTLGITEHHNAVDNVTCPLQTWPCSPAMSADGGSGPSWPPAGPEQRAGRGATWGPYRTSSPASRMWADPEASGASSKPPGAWSSTPSRAFT